MSFYYITAIEWSDFCELLSVSTMNIKWEQHAKEQWDNVTLGTQTSPVDGIDDLHALDEMAISCPSKDFFAPVVDPCPG